MAKKKRPNSVNLKDDPRLGKLRAVFVARGMLDLSLVVMVRMALDEWIAASASNRAK